MVRRLGDEIGERDVAVEAEREVVQARPEAAAALGISLKTAERYWVFARAWLCAELIDPE